MALEDYMLPCLIKKTFGVECFGCGAQSAFVLVLQGRFSEAFALFPAIYTLILLFLIWVFHFFDKKRNYHKIVFVLLVFNLFLMITSYVYKHL